MQKIANEVFTTNSVVNKITKHDIDEAFVILNKFEKEHAKEFSKIKDSYVEAFGAENADGSINRIPYKSLYARMADAALRPFKNLHWKLTKNGDALEKQHIQKEFSNFEGFLDSIAAWKKHNKGIDADGIVDKLRRREPKFISPDKAHYSTTSLSVGNRIVSGGLAGLYLASDAFNTTRLYDNDKKAANKEANIRLKQEYARIGANAVLTYVIFDSLRKFTNMKMRNAIGVGLATAFLTELVGRKMVGKPILPQSYEKLKDIEDKRLHKKQGILASDGSLSQGVRYSEIYSNKVKNNKAFASFTGNSVSFAGSKLLSAKKVFNVLGDVIDKEFTKPNLFDKKELVENLELLKKAYPQTHERYIKTIEKGFNKHSEFAGKALNDVIQDSSITRIPVGTADRPVARTGAAAVAPLTMLGKMFDNLTSKAVSLFIGKSKANLVDAEHQINKLGLQKEFKKALKENDSVEGQLKAVNDILKNDKNIKDELNGVKNSINLISKIKKTSNPQDVVKNVKQNRRSSVLKAFGYKGADYDAANFTLINRLALAGNTAIFLAIDAFNLANLHSKGDKKEARQKAKERTVQTAAKVALSAYMINLTVKMFHSVYNRSLPCALAVTALNVGIYETLSRVVTGFPIFRKDKQQLEELQAKNQNSKNPIIRFLAKTIGKNKFKKVQDIKETPIASQSINFMSTKSSFGIESTSNNLVNKYLNLKLQA